jgi:two-component system, NtrC family, nitrogen regulation response regulator GlnG
MKESTEILLVGSDREVSETLRTELLSRDYVVSTARRHEDGLAKAMNPSVAVVVSQVMDPCFSGLELLRDLHLAKPALPVILIDREVTTQRAIEAGRLGAYEHVIPPFSVSDLVQLIVKATSTEGGFLKVTEPESATPAGSLVGSTPVMRDLFKQIGIGANSSTTILIRGATGTGKELIARTLHQHSPRSGHPFIAVNCSTIASALIESEFFGHEEGSFTGARSRRIGFFEQAHGGTVFLDEIGDLPAATQLKLLRVLQDSSFYRVGGRQELRVDIKVIAATHRDLEKLIQDGQFREDLFQRLSGFPITTPELRSRREDIWPLIQHFLIKYRNRENGALPLTSIHRDAVSFLEGQSWPGNVRQLENTVNRAALLACGRPIGLEHVRQACAPHNQSSSHDSKPLREPPSDIFEKAHSGRLKNLHAHVLEQTERKLFQGAVTFARGNLSKIARLLGLSRKTVRGKLRYYQLVDAKNYEKR